MKCSIMLRLKQPSGTEIHHNLEKNTSDRFKYIMGSPIVIVSICMGKSIRIQSVYDRMFMPGVLFPVELIYSAN